MQIHHAATLSHILRIFVVNNGSSQFSSTRMLTTTDTQRAPFFEALQALPSLVREAVRGLQEHQLDTPYRDGGWTIRQVVHHIADSHLNGYTRMKLILTEDNPTLKTYDQDAWALLADSTLPVEPSLHIISGVHTRMLSLLLNQPDEAWQRTAQHPENGTVALNDILQIYAQHGANHVAQITSLRERMKW